MRVRTFEKLEAKITQDLAWRKNELIYIKTLIEGQTEDAEKENSILARAGISLLCAHWEGFIREVANLYVLYICGLKLKNKELNKNFLALFLKNNIMKGGVSKKTSIHTNLVETIDESKEKLFFIKYSDNNKIITTDSNLNYELFVEILKSINIDNRYELKANYIELNLLKVRHEIVHGEKVKLTREDFIETFEQVFEIMENFKEQVCYAAQEKLFLHNPGQ